MCCGWTSVEACHSGHLLQSGNDERRKPFREVVDEMAKSANVPS